MLDVITIIFWGIVMLGIVVFIHEGGHFLAARLMRVRVREFMFGLPGPSVGFTRKSTRYGVTAIPLGGYCLIAGDGGKESPHLADAYAYLAYWGTLTLAEAEKSSETLGFDLVEALDSLESWMTIKAIKLKAGDKRYEMLAASVDGLDYAQGTPRPVPDMQIARDHIAEERKHTYNGLPWWRRLVILLGGSFFNLVFAIAVITVVLMVVGVGEGTTTISVVSENSPAQQAGIVSGDVLLSVDGKPCETGDDFLAAIGSKKVGDTIELGYTHNGVARSVTITLAANDEGRPFVGVGMQIVRRDVYLPEALSLSVGLIGMVVKAITQLLNPATFSETVGQSSSVVGIAVEARKAATMGGLPFLLLSAQLCISIGLMNLLPVPPLDGGKIIVETIQRITRRIIPQRVITGISVTALLLLVFLFIAVTTQDIQRYFLGG